MAIVDSEHHAIRHGSQSVSSTATLPSQRIWVLLSNRVGDNAQVLALAGALNVPYEVRMFSNRVGAIATNLLLGTRLPHLVRGRAQCLTPPWPDLVIAAGTQSEPICAQIMERAALAGHQVQFVFLGRPWKRLDMYDLIVTTPQYRVPAAPNVMQIELPLHLVTRESVSRVAEIWTEKLAHLPKPYIMVCLGGSINRYTLDRYAAKRLAQKADALAASSGGSLLICSSFRTPQRAMKTVTEHLTRPSYVFDWRQPISENPYLAFLGLADKIIVTGDSMTMLAEACETRKPVYIFDLGEGSFSMKQPHVRPTNIETDWLRVRSTVRAFFKDVKVRLIRKILPERLHRDTHPVHRRLVQSGLAAWLDEHILPPTASVYLDSARDVASRVLLIMSKRRHAGLQDQIDHNQPLVPNSSWGQSHAN